MVIGHKDSPLGLDTKRPGEGLELVTSIGLGKQLDAFLLTCFKLDPGEGANCSGRGDETFA
jgi:hypothetical protein